jgi:hypothetical protein
MSYPQLSGEPNFVLIGISSVFGLMVIIIVYYIFISKNSKNQLGNNMDSPLSLNASVLGLGLGVNVGGTGSGQGAGSGAGAGAGYGPSGYGPSPSPTLGLNSGAPVPINTGGFFAPVPTSAPKATVSNPNIKQVFNIKNNIYTLDDSAGVCGALGANVASINQLIDAHKQGADWCNVGWTSDGLAAYPIQYSTWKTLQDNEPSKRNICGSPGINLARNDPNLLYGVNCYGVKPEPKGNEIVKGEMISDKQAAINAKIAEFQRNINAIGVVPFNANSWSE